MQWIDGRDLWTCYSPPNTPDPTYSPIEFDLCAQAGPLEGECLACGEGKIWTSLGCVLTSNEGLAQSLAGFGFTIAGGIAILLMLFGAFKVTTAASNPQNLQVGREIISAAIVGLLFIVLSVVILQLIGVQVLRLPGL